MSNITLTTFTFALGDAPVRMAEIDGEPWFVATDVLAILDLTDDRNHLKKLADDEKRIVLRSNVNLPEGYAFPNRGANCISESGLYKLIMRAHPNVNPVARKFQRWLTDEVLPAIRKDGMYAMGEEKVRSGEMSEDELVLKAMTILQNKVERLASERAASRLVAGGSG